MEEIIVTSRANLESIVERSMRRILNEKMKDLWEGHAPDEIFTIQEAGELLHLAKSTISVILVMIQFLISNEGRSYTSRGQS